MRFFYRPFYRLNNVFLGIRKEHLLIKIKFYNKPSFTSAAAVFNRFSVI